MRRLMDLATTAHVIRLIALVLAIALDLVLISDCVFYADGPVDRKRVIGLAFGAIVCTALAAWMMLNPPE